MFVLKILSFLFVASTLVLSWVLARVFDVYATFMILLAVPIWLVSFVFSPGNYRFDKVSRLADIEGYPYWLFLQLGSDSRGDSQRVRFCGLEFVVNDRAVT